jgi:hypothetical protein
LKSKSAFDCLQAPLVVDGHRVDRYRYRVPTTVRSAPKTTDRETRLHVRDCCAEDLIAIQSNTDKVTTLSPFRYVLSLSHRSVPNASGNGVGARAYGRDKGCKDH